MLTPGKYDITILKGADFPLELQILDDAEDPVDLTGWSVAAVVRERNARTAEEIIDLAPAITDAADGMISIFIDSEDTGDITHRRGYWDLRLTDPDGLEQIYVYGVATISEIVTGA